MAFIHTKRLGLVLSSLFVFTIFTFWGTAEAAFSDIANHPSRAAIEYIAGKNIVSGYSDGSFRPEKKVNRAELLKMIIGSRYSGLGAASCFPDVKKEAWFAPFVCKAKELGVVQGYPDGFFRPGSEVNFVEALIITQRAYNLEIEPSSSAVWYEGSVRSAKKLGIIPENNVLAFNAKLTRGEVAQLLMRVLQQGKNPRNETEVPSPLPASDEVRVRNTDELRAAVAAARPGRTITLASGVYNLAGRRISTSQNGTAAGRITIRAEQKTGVIIETAGAEEAFIVANPYYVFENLHVKIFGAGSYHGYKFNGNGHSGIIRGGVMEIFKGTESGIKGASGTQPPYPDNLLVENTEIFFREPTDYVVAEGIDGVGMRGWIIRNNVIHGVKKTDQNTVAWGVLLKGNSQDTIVEGNLFYDCDVAIAIGGLTGPQYFRDGNTTLEHRGGIVRNNVSIGTRDVALYMEDAQGAKVYHNTFIDSYQAGGSSSIDLRFSSSADIRNNILDKPILDREGATHTAASNIILGTSYSTFDFVNVAARNLKLKSGSALYAAAVAAGVRLPEVPTDKDGAAREGSAVDIGAYEFASSR